MSTEHLDQDAPAKTLRRESIPNFDIAALFCQDTAARNALIADIKRTCFDTGFFYVHNSNVSKQLINETLAAMKLFFDSPDEGLLKQSVHNRYADQMKGWGPMFGEPSYQKDTVAHLESFDIGQPLTSEQLVETGAPANLWPDIPGFRETVLDYYQAVTTMGRALAEALSEMLEMERGFINSISGIKAPRTMRLLHYPANDAPHNSRNVGISAHTDFECFTIMNQTAGGLELTNVAGEWCEAPSDIGTFTIILGDMTERFSNGQLKASGHRVVNTPWTRYSMVLFFAVDGDYEVSPLPAFVSDDQPPRYAPITQNRHIEQELARAAGH